MDFAVIFQLVLVGVLAGLLAGIFGVGGGLLVVPMLIILLPEKLLSPLLLTHSAVATSLASIVFTGSVSAWRHYQRKGIDGYFARWLSIGVVFGAAIGAYLSRLVAAQQLQYLIVVYEIMIAIRLLLPKYQGVSSSLRQVSVRLNLSVGVIIGAVSSWLGIGGGSMSVPFLRWVGLDMRHAVATSALIGVPIALAASVTFMLMNPLEATMPPFSVGFVYLPALLFIVLGSVFSVPVGVSLAHRLPQTWLQRAFALVLLTFAAIIAFK